MTLSFYMPTVTLLIQHTKESNVGHGALDQISGPKYTAKSNSGIPPGLILVKEETIYLMPNAGLFEGQTAVAAGLVCRPIGSQPNFKPNFYEQAAMTSNRIRRTVFVSNPWLRDLVVLGD